MLINDQIKNILSKIMDLKEEQLLYRYDVYTTCYSKDDITKCNAEKGEIFRINSLIDYDIYSEDELNFIKKLGIYSFVGELGNQNFNALLATHSLNKSEVIKQVRARRNSLNTIFDKIEYMINIFDFTSEDIMKDNLDILGKDTGILTIHFQKDCNITGLEELRKSANDWNILIRAIYSLTGETPPDNIEFLEIRKGSLNIDLKMTVEVLLMVGGLVTWSLNSYSKILEIKKQRLELNKIRQTLELDEEHFKPFEEAFNRKIDEKMKGIANEIIAKLKDEKGLDDLENHNELENSVRTIIVPRLTDFIEKGGEVTIQTKGETEDEKIVEDLSHQINEQLEFIENPKYIEDKR